MEEKHMEHAENVCLIWKEKYLMNLKTLESSWNTDIYHLLFK